MIHVTVGGSKRLGRCGASGPDTNAEKKESKKKKKKKKKKGKSDPRRFPFLSLDMETHLIPVIEYGVI